MITEFKVQGQWRENEAAGAASALLSRYDAGDEFLNDFHIRVEAETENGKVRIISDEDLTDEQVTLLRDYFEKHPEQDMPQWERAKLAADKVRQEEMAVRVNKFLESGVSVNQDDLKDALRVLAELAGVEVSRVSARGTTNQNI